jgi:hypothetical protein
MPTKKILLSLLLLSTLTAATAGYRWWRDHDKKSAAPLILPSAREELQKLARWYRQPADSPVCVTGTIRIYDRENRDSLKETRTFRYVRSGKGYYMQLSYLQTFCDGAWLVQLDTVNHQLVVEKAPAGDAATVMNFVTPPEKLFSDTAQFRTTGTVMEEGKERSLRMTSELNPEIRSATLYYDTLTYRIGRAGIEWWKPGTAADEKGEKVWLAKIDYQYPPVQKMDLRLKIRSIVDIDGRQVTAVGVYRDYDLHINNN